MFYDKKSDILYISYIDIKIKGGFISEKFCKYTLKNIQYDLENIEYTKDYNIQLQGNDNVILGFNDKQFYIKYGENNIIWPNTLDVINIIEKILKNK